MRPIIVAGYPCIAQPHPCTRLICVCGSKGEVAILAPVNDSEMDTAYRISRDCFQRKPSILFEASCGETCKMVKQIGSIQLRGEVFSSPIVIGNRIFVGCRDDNVYCLSIV